MAAPAANHRGTADHAAARAAVVTAEDASTRLAAARTVRSSLKFFRACKHACHSQHTATCSLGQPYKISCLSEDKHDSQYNIVMLQKG